MDIDYLEKNFIKTLIPTREISSHKGDFGKVLLITGSYKYPGSTILSGKAVYRSGAGVVSIIADRFLERIYASNFFEATYLNVNDIRDIDQYRNILDVSISRYKTVLLGPGLDTDEGSLRLTEFLVKYLKDKDVRLVIDADGLNNLSRVSQWWEYLPLNTLITPHIGEFRNLLGFDFSLDDSIKLAKEKSEEWRCSIVLKNSKTIISKGSQAYLNNNENSLLSTAGTGDILSGIIAGFISQGVDPFEAACIGVYIHSLVGLKLRDTFSDRGMLASDMLKQIPIVIKEIS